MQMQEYADFVEEIRQGKAMRIISYTEDRVELSPLPSEYKLYDWALPVFDFGFAFDPSSKYFVGIKIWNDLWSEAKELLEKKKMRIPFPECIFLFKYKKTQQREETINIVHLIDDDNQIEGTVFFQQSAFKSPQNRWTKTPFQFVLLGDNQCEINFDPSVDLSEYQANEFKMDARTKYTESVVGALLLKSYPQFIDEQEDFSPRLAQVNRGRVETKKLPPLSSTRLIKIDHQGVLSAMKTQHRTGAAKSPHERRGHYRSLRSGKNVWVKNSRIKGGSETPPDYKITNS